MEVAGPPGTGKTKTIIEVVRGLLECTNKDTIVLSERNGAIDAIAEKFADVCLRTSGFTVKGVKDVPLWMNVMAYGAVKAMGPSAKLFTLDEKMRCVNILS
jgi:Cdc6-like AAA superfamily ATPase